MLSLQSLLLFQRLLAMTSINAMDPDVDAMVTAISIAKRELPGAIDDATDAAQRSRDTVAANGASVT